MNLCIIQVQALGSSEANVRHVVERVGQNPAQALKRPLEKWYQKTPIQAAIVTGLFLIIAAIIQTTLSFRSTFPGGRGEPASQATPEKTANPPSLTETPAPGGGTTTARGSSDPTGAVEADFSQSEFVRRKLIEKALLDRAQLIDAAANARERDKPFPQINRSIEATGDTATQEKLQGYDDFDSFVWNAGVRVIFFINDNDIPFVESIFFLGRNLDETRDVVVAWLYRGVGRYEVHELIRSSVNDPAIIQTVIRAAKDEKQMLEPLYRKVLSDFRNSSLPPVGEHPRQPRSSGDEPLDAQLSEEKAARLIKVSGDSQVARPGQAFPEPFVVLATDEYGKSAPGTIVRFTPFAAECTDHEVETDPSGYASVRCSAGQLPPGAGISLQGALAAQVPGRTREAGSTTFNFAVALGALTVGIARVSGDDQIAMPGSTVPVVFRLTTGSGNTGELAVEVRQVSGPSAFVSPNFLTARPFVNKRVDVTLGSQVGDVVIELRVLAPNHPIARFHILARSN